MLRYNDLKAHLYNCKENNGYHEFNNILDYFMMKNKNKFPKWLSSSDPEKMHRYEIDTSVIKKYLVKSKYFTLTADEPEFEKRSRSMKL